MMPSSTDTAISSLKQLIADMRKPSRGAGTSDEAPTLDLESSSPVTRLNALLRLSRTINEGILETEEEIRSVATGPESVSPLDTEVLDVIRTCASSSGDEVAKALDYLLSRRDLSTERPKSIDPEDLYDVSASISQSIPAPSQVYTARAPRLPGFPAPLPDEFGDWDEYRDDLDPGYRVRDVYEEDYLREFDSTSSISRINQGGIDDELLASDLPSSYVANPSVFSNQGLSLDVNDDELCGAVSSIIGQSSVETRRGGSSIESPVFGDSKNGFTEDMITSPMKPEDALPPANEPVTTYWYDYMGNVTEVVRPTSAETLGKSTPSPPTPIVSKMNLPVVFYANKTGFELSKEFDSSVGTIVAGRYRITGYLGSAAFSKAVKAVDLTPHARPIADTLTSPPATPSAISSIGDEVCLKIIKNEKDFVDQSLDEIKILQLLKQNSGHQYSCVSIRDFFYWKEHLVIVTELLLDNLYEFSKFNRNPTNGQSPYFTIGHLQRIALQVTQSLRFIHSLGLIHCDLKPENILFSSYTNCAVKVIDFGSSCFRTDKLSSYVQSRCYRAPEVVLGCLPYDSRVDLWSLGCILAELWTGFVLFQNDSSQSLLARITGILGPVPKWMLQTGRAAPQFFLQGGDLFLELDGAGVVSGKGRLLQLLVAKKTWLFQRMRIQDFEFLDFLSRLLQVDPALRMDATEALAHPWLKPGRYSDGL